MFDPSAAAIPTADQQQLLRLNIDFLRLLISSTPPPTTASSPRPFGLSAAQTSALAQCDAAGLQRMAGCGFSLFSLALHRADIWQRAITSSAAQADVRHYGLGTGTQDDISHIRIGFIECALFFAWHLSQHQPRNARFLLGMSEDCAQLVARMELWQCRQLAQTQDKLLSPRWTHHPYFWSDLLRYGSSGDAQHFKFACLLGSQLMAQDLEPSAILHLSNTE